jgi:superfamily II DNA helicase RecQ
VRITTFFLPFDEPSAVVPLNQLLASSRVLHVERHFVDRAHACGWSLVVTHEAPRGAVVAPAPAPLAPAAAAGRSEVDYRQVLPPEQFAMFSKLRQLRKDISHRDNVPPYALFNNEQLAAMVTSGVRTAAQLGALEGVGPARVSRYGEAFLALLREFDVPA